jgi:hypothetical protein
MSAKKKPVKKRPAARPKPRPSKKAETGIDAVKRLQKVIDQKGHDTYGALVFSEPIDPVEVAMAERKLGVRLPPSYVKLVTKHGCFKLVWEKPEDGTEYPKLRGCRALLPPADIASETIGARKAYAKTRTGEMLAESLLFQENYYRDNFYTFRVSEPLGGRAAAKSREMSVHVFFHDDVYEWRVRYVSFEDHLREWVSAVLDDR